MNPSDFKIDTGCPQCGAPVILDESDHMVQCGFCRTRHIILTHPFACYALAPLLKAPGNAQWIHVPYWRFRGMVFAATSFPMKMRVADHSLPAVESDGWPASLGLRPQARPLKFIRPDMTGLFLKPERSRGDMIREMTGNGPDMFHIGERLSLIFMPFYRHGNLVCDGLTGNALDPGPSLPDGPGAPPPCRLSFVPCLCPDCGWDLEGRNTSLVLSCQHCRAFWLIHQNRLNRIRPAFSVTGPDTALMLPFWRLRVGFGNLGLDTFAHLIRQANLPLVIQPRHQIQPLFFDIPAFSLSPKLFLRLGKQMTLARVAPDRAVPDGEAPTRSGRSSGPPLYPVHLPLDEAVEATRPVLLELAVRKKELAEALGQEKISLIGYKLMYMAFIALGNDYVQGTAGTGLPKKALAEVFES